MKQKYKTYLVRTVSVWLGCSLLFFLVNILVLAPQRDNQKQIEKQLAEKKQIYDFALNASRKQTRDKLNKEIESLTEKIEDFVIDSQNLANLIFDISQIANDKAVDSFQIRSKQNRKNFSTLDCNSIGEQQIEIGFAAGFNQFATFLNSLERHRPVVFVDNFIITRSQKNNAGHRVKMNLSVFVKKRQGG